MDGPVAVAGVNGNGLGTPVPSTVDPELLVDHFHNIAKLLLGATDEDLKAPGSFLNPAKLSETLQRCSRFAQESQDAALYLVQEGVELNVDGSNDSSAALEFIYRLTPDLAFSSTCVSCILLLKSSGQIDARLPIHSQIRPSSFSVDHAGGVQGISSLLHYGVSAPFDAATKSSDSSTRKWNKTEDTRIGSIAAAKRKLTELELALLHLQQNTDIPPPVLHLHPAIQSAVDTAAEEEYPASIEMLPPKLLNDSTFLNQLQSNVNQWIHSIQNTTKVDRDPSKISASQEINFWLQMEHALELIEQQLSSAGVLLTLEVLRNAKRFQATISFTADTGLREKAETVQKYNLLMRDFPLKELLSADSLTEIAEAVNLIFTHLNKKLKLCPYPVRRALPLVESISGDLDTRLHRLLNGRTIMHLEYPRFQTLMAEAESIFRAWDDNAKEFTNVAREVTRRRNEKFIPIKINPRQLETQARLKYISNFRHNHDQLQRTIVNVLGSSIKGANENGDGIGAIIVDELGDVDAAEEVAEAYAALRDVDVLDVSPEGTARWSRAEAEYNDRTSRVENSIIARLRDRLATAKGANEMFRVFSKFNALFVRPKIRSAISEYQTQLIEEVKRDIQALHERFKQRYGHSESHAMAQLRDLPPVSGAIIWARQIERQLDSYMRKVEDILGRDWHLHTEGQKLEQESRMFRKKLDTKPIFDSWFHEVARRNVSISGRLFKIEKIRASANTYELVVNFDEQVITLFKEVRNLWWLNFQVPHAINNVSKDAKRVYPYAVTLMETIRNFAQTSRSISEMSEISALLNGYQNEAYALVTKGIPLKWESFVNVYDIHASRGVFSGAEAAAAAGRSESRHVQFVREFTNAINVLQSKTTALASINVTVQAALKDLEVCSYSASAFRQNIDVIQKAVDQLNLENYANLHWWVEETNLALERILLGRLRRAIAEWLEVFNNADGYNDALPRSASHSDEYSAKNLPKLNQLVHEITIRNQAIFLKPPLEYARAKWLEELQTWLGVIGTLKKVEASRYEMKVQPDVEEVVQDFSYLPGSCAETLSQVHTDVESKLSTVSEYVDKWLQFQSLWDLRIEQVFEELQEDLSLWLQILQEILNDRDTFDTSEVSVSFGHITVNYEQVQLKVNGRYDQWQQDILARFALLLGARMNLVFTEIQQARKDLEGQALEASSTQQAVSFITTVQQCKRKVKSWAVDVELFRQGETTLRRQRHQFPKGWLSMEQIENEWTMLNQVLERKGRIVEDQSDALRAKIIAEDNLVHKKIQEISAQWVEEKPISGNIPPNEAELVLQAFELKLTRLRDEADGVSKAKEALDLQPSPQNTLPSLLEEVQDFRSVWASLKTIWDNLNDLREQPWASVQPRKLRHRLDDLLKMMKDMPARMRQYAAFEHMQGRLRQLLKVNSLLSEMRSDAMQDRHWIKVFKQLSPKKRYAKSSMTLGDVYDLQLSINENTIKEVLIQAQGELALEEFLRQVRETWQNYSLDLVNYQNKCRLIRGWDELFQQCSEHLNSLQAMRHSPYYREFQQEASLYEDRLNQIHVLFDVWIDVQRQWVYLEGVFTGNADIKHLLRTESAHFKNINGRFFEVMKLVSKSPLVMDVLAIPDIQNRLEELAALLNKIQKALGEYLERERIAFPRFYFVGDEDLLEIIGNSSDTQRVSKHLRKMFAGLATLVTDDESSIVGFISKEGEKVFLQRDISLIKTPKVNEWLTALEHNMKLTLAALLADAVKDFAELLNAPETESDRFTAYIAAYPAQIVVLAAQVCWTDAVEEALKEGGSPLGTLHDRLVSFLRLLANAVLVDMETIQRRKCEHLITEFVHQRDVVAKLKKVAADSPSHHMWQLQMRYVYRLDAEPLDRLHVKMANASIVYGYEYLGVPDRLVRTPLTDRCFLTLTQALSQRLGGSPYGPAGTGKTESVKALGLQLGRFTLVFCCDDTFDFQAMGRIFLGICKVGAWGCFDEFNRLEERILSAVSQQIQNIQLGLRKAMVDDKAEIELIGRNLKVHANTGIFITMNPGYAGRSNLPDNLKKLFRSVAMSKPDKELIAEVMLYSQGFSCAKELSRQTVPFFELCLARLSKQAHYDFGLRALKSVLVSSGGLKRARLVTLEHEEMDEKVFEPQIIVQSLRETIAPKLIRSDVELMLDIERESFPGVAYVPAPLEALQKAIREEAAEARLVATDSWMTKVLQLYQIQMLHHGVMMVGSAGSGKSSAWRILLKALQRVEGVEGVCHVIDPKVMSKEHLYGTLDSTTREWTDGLFTNILRKIVDNLRGEESKRHWIVFDGDVDPVWVENLNSVLDDNKMLTLPNGERLNLPSNVRIMFEVETLRYATLATVSRCGMVWFSNDTVTTDMIVSNYLSNLREIAFDDIEDASVAPGQLTQKLLATQGQVAGILQQRLMDDGFILKALDQARQFRHIMEVTDIRVLNTLFSLLNKACRNVLDYNVQHSDFPLEASQIEAYLSKRLLLALVWSLTGDCPLSDRKAFGDVLTSMTAVDLPSITENTSLIDFDVTLPKGEWSSWQSQVTSIEVDTHSVTDTDVVIPTLDTVRHEDILYSWLAEHKPLILCGPPGSGKTMTLFNALKKLEHMEVVGLNFSSATTPDLLIKTFEQYCEYRKTLNGVVLTPSQVGRWLVLFCDEINLPAPDKYGTPRAISFLRQLIEQNGFWRTSDKTWVTLDRIQFVGACNPPTDPGRTPLGLRFLRHAPVVMVDYPGELSLLQIYGTFNSAVLKIISSLRGYSEPLTKAMVQVYSESQKRFTPDIQPHYVYSPRELTRWVRGVYEAIRPLDTLSLEGLVRIWAHEALRLFQDRLIAEDERKWTEAAIHRIALEHFPTLDEEKALAAPILFSSWDSKNYVPVERERLRDIVNERLKTFCEEEVDVRLIPFNDLLEHVLRIDRVFRQSQGHLILIGVSGSGKTTLSRFVAWMNGLKVYQIKVHGKYSAEDFDEDLRNVLRRCGCKGEKICFILDESNVLDSGFLERMNTLLANAEIPGLFEGDEFATLMTQCREGAQREGDKGHMLDSPEELYKWFKAQISKNLHVVFTMNPPTEGLSGKAATSPALFNRCVLNWFGDWSDQALYQVGSELTQSIDLDRSSYAAPQSLEIAYRDLPLPPSHRDAVVNGMVHIHYSLHRFNERLAKQQDKITYLTPRHFLDFVDQFVRLHREKREDLEEQQRHLNVGLDKLRETVDKVRDLRQNLAEKKNQLERKNREANDKLTRMLADQKEAESRKKASEEVQKALEQQERDVAERQEVVMRDLANAEPAVAEAQKSVSNIKRQHLQEVRSMARPPTGVKLAMEAVCTLLGHKNLGDWGSVTSVIRQEGFIPSIVNYDNEKQMTRALRIKMRNDYLSKEEFTYDRVNRASKACGPLVQWVEAQVNYADILERVGPLREEVGQLENAALQTKEQARVIEDKIKALEKSIEEYKAEYALLISETQTIKQEMDRVQSKVDRSVRLLESLSSERIRWEESSKSFETQIDTLVGDVLVAAAVMAYGGFYDQQYRKAMMDDWLHHLSLSGIRYKEHNPVTEYLSTADERLKWQENTLPVDDLCTENAIMLKRFNRYPLIIDPSGRVTEFLQNEFKNRKLTVTSFLDDSFTKQLESSLRFGNPILIQDAEHLDPILTHVLNKEHQKTGGRVLIQLGKQEIDFSPAFKLFLSTRDPSANFAPDICSRTTLVNFTVTQSSLQTQSLNEVLKSERPDVDERRSNVIKMQGEFSVHLRRLEKQLLQALNESRGNILDDDNVLQTLEKLKTEAAIITAKAAETEGVWAEVENITLQYKVVARSCAAIFAVLEQLHRMNHFYQFSLQYFTGIFLDVLAKAKALKETNNNARIDFIVRNLFISTYRRTSLAMLQKDRVALAMLLAQAAPYKMDKSLIDLCLDSDLEGVDVSTETHRKDEAMARVLKLRQFKDVMSNISSADWERFLTEELAENDVPNPWPASTESFDQQLLSLILVKLFRVDRFVPAVERFVTTVFGSNLLDISSDLGDIIKQVSAVTPVALSSSPGFDASYRVENLVERNNVSCTNIAMGSNEGVATADKAVSNAAATGNWVLVKNVHLSPAWLQSLEKRIDSLKPHPDFRLFLCMETSPKIPVNLLRASRILMNEQPAGIKANMKDSLSSLSTKATKQPVERARVYLLLSFLHAVIQERLRYAPNLGWKGFWEFNDSDYECCSHIIDYWVETVAQSRTNVNPKNIPWAMIRTLLTEMYGGKIDDEEDYATLSKLVDSVMTPAAFEEDYDIVQDVQVKTEGEEYTPLVLPSGAGWKDFMGWVGSLPEREPPTFLGLPANAEKLLLVGQAKEMMRNLSLIMGILDEGEQVMAEVEM
ncbi:cytoplasmic dynein-like protein 1 heavy chain 1 [Trichodelitschia bisporula]|uniref:Dynein heavy chain, cytoplasmic n=1 Tax=Trichodelitschia bisporula TaxID=703511 RepID=A0A6G1HLA4_9PEZI|nr:cytoplasmic dynein-like protein 1 heavy chain 1 [Trichodelitschia bisporula]